MKRVVCCALPILGWAGIPSGDTGMLMPGNGREEGVAASEGIGEARLTGTWGGWRDRLARRGVQVSATYTAETLSSVRGGLDRGTAFEGIADVAIDADLEALLGWSETTTRIRAIWPHGRSPSSRYVGDFLGLSNIDAFRHQPTLYELWIEKGFHELHVRAGMLLADEEFATVPGGDIFMNSAFGWPTGIALNTRNTGPAFFRPAPGLRVRWDAAPGWFLQAGLYDGDTFDGDPDRDDPWPDRIGGLDGFFAIAESAFSWGGACSDPDPLPGRVIAGGWFHTADFESFERDGDRGPNGGVYVTGEQMILRHADKPSLTAFARIAWSPPERSMIDWSGDFGLRMDDWLGRDEVIAAGVAWAHMSDRWRNSLPRAEGRRAEITLEVTVRIPLGSGWFIQPGFQWILFSGDPAIDDAHVIGFRTEFEL